MTFSLRFWPSQLVLAGLVLAGDLAVPLVSAQEKAAAAPVIAQQPAAPKVDPKVDPKKEPEQPTPVTPKYPKEIDGKDLLYWLNEAQKNPDPQLRQSALNIIPLFGPDARKPAISPLVAIVRGDRDPGVKMAAISLLSIMGFEDKIEEQRAINAIREVLVSSREGSITRAYCLKSLSSFGPSAATPITIGAVRTALFDPSWETRLLAVQTLGSIGMPRKEEKNEPARSGLDSGSPVDPIQYDAKSAHPAALKAIIDIGLTDTCAAVRLEAVQSLIRCGAPVPKNPLEYAKMIDVYLKPINKRVNDKDENGKTNLQKEKSINVLIWLHVVQIMYNAETIKEIIPKITAYLKHTDRLTRANAINALMLLGEKANVAVPDVIEALNDEDPTVIASAINFMALMGKDAGAALPELEKIKNGSKDSKRPVDAPKDWKPDTTLREMAKEAIEYVSGKRKLGDPPPPPPAEKKDEKKP